MILTGGRPKTKKNVRSFLWKGLMVLFQLWFVAILVSPWIILWRLDNDMDMDMNTGVGKATADNNFQQGGGGVDVTPPPIVLTSCQDLFGSHQIVRKGPCLHHRLLQWLSCEIGGNYDDNEARARVWINPSLIQGSTGGEHVEDVLFRPEEVEQLKFPKGSLLVLQTTKNNNVTKSILSTRLLNSVDVHMRRFLQSTATVTTEKSKPKTRTNSTVSQRDGEAPTLLEKPQTGGPAVDPPTVFTSPSSNDDGITLLVRRGNYANPCMALLTMYNVYIVLEHYYDYFVLQQNDDRRRSLNIIWLDGHAKGDLDIVWHRLFQTQPRHIKQVLNTNETPARQNNGVQLSPHVMVVNTMSAIGDEGLGLYQWGGGGGYTPPTTTTDNHEPPIVDKKQPKNRAACWKNSTLVHFRDFVLERYGLSRYQKSSSSKKILTLLVRTNYRAHPRSTGETDRTLGDVNADAAYLQSLYPFHSVQVVSFEGMPFDEQLGYIRKTDVLVAVHGAGNIHVLFLPDNATLLEYVPKSFSNRRRFRYLAECLNVTYVARPAWIERRWKSRQQYPSDIALVVRVGNTTATTTWSSIQENHPNNQNTLKDLIQVRLRPLTTRERENANLR